MTKRILLALLLVLGAKSAALALTINAKGSSGVAVAVTTASAVTVLDADPKRTSATLYADQQMNCMPGAATGGAPAIAPTTGAMGTGAGFPIPASTLVTISADRSVPLGNAGMNLYLDPGARLDCIAASSNGHVATWENQ